MQRGTAICSTSSGSSTMTSPLNENITTIVKSSAMRVMGEMRGMNSRSYHSRPFHRNMRKRVAMPPKNGMPR